MAPKANQTVIDRALSHEPIPGAIIVDRKERKAQAARFQKTRRLKQSFMGAVFLILLAAGWLYPLIGYFIPFCMVLGIGLAAFQGRSWCNWVCPRGSFEDAWLAKISRRRPIPPIFRSTRLPRRGHDLPDGDVGLANSAVVAEPLGYRQVFRPDALHYHCGGRGFRDDLSRADVVLYLPHRHHVKLGRVKTGGR